VGVPYGTLSLSSINSKKKKIRWKIKMLCNYVFQICEILQYVFLLEIKYKNILYGPPITHYIYMMIILQKTKLKLVEK
jgi:hypothetical protein